MHKHIYCDTELWSNFCNFKIIQSDNLLSFPCLPIFLINMFAIITEKDMLRFIVFINNILYWYTRWWKLLKLGSTFLKRLLFNNIPSLLAAISLPPILQVIFHQSKNCFVIFYNSCRVQFKLIALFYEFFIFFIPSLKFIIFIRKLKVIKFRI